MTEKEEIVKPVFRVLEIFPDENDEQNSSGVEFVSFSFNFSSVAYAKLLLLQKLSGTSDVAATVAKALQLYDYLVKVRERNDECLLDRSAYVPSEESDFKTPMDSSSLNSVTVELDIDVASFERLLPLSKRAKCQSVTATVMQALRCYLHILQAYEHGAKLYLQRPGEEEVEEVQLDQYTR